VAKELINIFILNHGEFGESIVKSAEMIAGKIDDIYVFSLKKDMSLEEMIENVESKFKSVNGKKILLTDIFGGTPNNVAMYLKHKYQCHVISGFNLAMILELVLSRDNQEKTIDQMVDDSIAAAIESIKNQEIPSDLELDF